MANESGDGWRLPGREGHLDLRGLKPGPARDFAPFADKARTHGWRVVEIGSGQVCQAEKPKETAAALHIE